MRAMAKVVVISRIEPIEGANAIEVAVVGGWRVVVKLGEFQPQDKAIYFEIDAFLPEGEDAWDFLVQKSSKVFAGRRGHALRTVRLRGQLSQGLLLPVRRFSPALQSKFEACGIGDDVAADLGVVKFEPPVPAELAGVAKGPFPTQVPKTDQERIQNLTGELLAWCNENAPWEVTEKLEGSSCTYALLDDEFVVCSRQVNLIEAAGNTLWRLARELDLEARLRALCAQLGRSGVALQGEVVGHGIQGNIYGLKGQAFLLFDVYDVDAGRYLAPQERVEVAQALGLAHVPVLDPAFTIDRGITAETLLAMADGDSLIKVGVRREGLVFKRAGASFKAISNAYLLKQP